VAAENSCEQVALEAGFKAIKKLEDTVKQEDIKIEDLGSRYAAYVRHYTLFHIIKLGKDCKVESVNAEDFRGYLPADGV
jgi:hypothetical protein